MPVLAVVSMMRSVKTGAFAAQSGKKRANSGTQSKSAAIHGRMIGNFLFIFLKTSPVDRRNAVRIYISYDKGLCCRLQDWETRIDQTNKSDVSGLSYKMMVSLQETEWKKEN